MNPDGQEKHHKPGSDAAKEQRARILAAFRQCFSGDSGKLVLAVLEQSTGYGRPSFIRPASGPYDPLAAAIRDGRKSVLDEIHAYLNTPADGTPGEPAAIRDTSSPAKRSPGRRKK